MKKIKLNFRRVAEEKLVEFTAATMGEEVPPTHGDIPQTPGEIEKEIKRANAFMGAREWHIEKAMIENLQSEPACKKLEARIAEITADQRSRTWFGFGAMKQAARKELAELQGKLEELNARYEKNAEFVRQSNEASSKIINRVGRMQEVLGKSSPPAPEKPEVPAASPAARKISLNFKRVTGAQSEAMAEGTLVTGGFNLPALKQQQKAEAAAEEARQEALRRMKMERDEAERRKQLEAEEARRQALEAQYRMAEEAARRRAAGDGFGGNRSEQGKGYSGPTSSGW